MSRTNFKFDFSASSSSFHCRRSLGLSRHFRNIIDKRFDDRASLARSLVRSRAMKKPGRKAEEGAPSRNSTMKDRTMRARLKMRNRGRSEADPTRDCILPRSISGVLPIYGRSWFGLRKNSPSLSVLSYKGSSHHFAHPNAKLKPFRAQRQRASLRK